MHIRTGLFVLSLACACRESSDGRPSLVSEPQIIAVEADPPDTSPGQTVNYRVVTVGPDGELAPDDLTLSYCQTAKAVGDNRVASLACAENNERDTPVGRVPSDACMLFGPSVAATARPPDPDATGGYYQPLRVAWGAISAVAMQRLRCSLPSAPVALLQEFRERYVANQNPVLSPLSLSLDGDAVAFDDVPANRELSLRVSWPQASREPYVWYDREQVQLSTRTEALRVAWFVTAGELSYDATGRAANETSLDTENRWFTPERAGTVHLWLVLRDDRGGTTHASYDLTVR
ncbi:MAG: hypothetical protein RL701_4495 [Pseudomonadota bacterium]|jgi:hypothetical protein